MIFIKKCTICNLTKPIDDFYSQLKTRKDGSTYTYHNPYCKECTGNKYKQWVKDNRDRKRERDREWVKKPENVPKVRKNQRMYIERGKRSEWENKNKDRLNQYSRFKRMHGTHEITEEEWVVCKEYFNNTCAYCGMSEEIHKEIYGQQLHKEHVDHNGTNGIANCVPSCKHCNSKKWTFEFNEWYNENNTVFNEERLKKIISWLNIFN